jgi:hypothetical protein
MEIREPNEWTKDYVKKNTEGCLNLLVEYTMLVIKYIEDDNYTAAVAGTDRILNGLIVLLNAGIGNFRPYISQFSLCQGNLIAFGNIADESKSSQVKKNALAMYEDAYDFAKTDRVKDYLSPIIGFLKEGGSLAELKEEIDPDFPKDTLDSFKDLLKKLNQIDFTPSSSSGGCYIATCVYGSYDCPYVWTLRRWRDDVLQTNWLGRIFVRVYYAVSPKLVKWFGESKWFKSFWKKTLDRFVARLNQRGVEDTEYFDK